MFELRYPLSIIFALSSVAVPAYANCKAEYEQTMGIPQTTEQLKQNSKLENFDPAGDDGWLRWLIVRAHLKDNPFSPGEARFRSDPFPLSACILRALSESRSKEVAPLAQEAYAMKLLNGEGVPRDRQEAIKYLNRASESWHYGSASIRLGKLYLEGKPSKEDIERASYFLNRALKLAATTAGGSENPGDATEILFDIYLSGKYGGQNLVAAKELLRERRSKSRPDDGLYRATMKYPTLAAAEKEIIVEERQAAIDRQNARPESRKEICTTYSNGFKSCRPSSF